MVPVNKGKQHTMTIEVRLHSDREEPLTDLLQYMVKNDLIHSYKIVNKVEEIPEFIRPFAEWKRKNSLIRLLVSKGRGVQKNFAARVIEYDTDKGTVLVYDVDTKQTDSIHINQIDDVWEVK